MIKYGALCCWAFQIILWMFVIGLAYFASFYNSIIMSTRGKSNILSILIVFVFLFWVIYIYVQCYSKHSFMLSSRKEEREVEGYLTDLTSKPPIISWSASCYHYVGYGKNRRRVTSHSETRSMTVPFYKDISGHFHLDAEKVKNSAIKKYILLSAEIDFQFSDDVTKLDYQTEKDNFYNAMKNRDTYLDFSEERTIEGHSPFSLIKLAENDAPFTNYCILMFFVFLGIAEVYKLYIDIFCVDQEYTFKKIISTRYNINNQTNENFQQYEEQRPMLTIFKKPSKVIEYTPAPFVADPRLPNQDELAFARKVSQSGINFGHTKGPVEYRPYFDQPHPFMAQTGNNNAPGYSSSHQNPWQNNNNNNNNNNADQSDFYPINNNQNQNNFNQLPNREDVAIEMKAPSAQR
jgi:hypothetical protein